MIPEHAAEIGHSLPPLYFNPGSYEFQGKLTGSTWVEAFFAGKTYRYERADLGLPWVRVA